MLNADDPVQQRARVLRSAMSLPEVLLWRELRRRPLGLKFRRQHPTREGVADFYCHSARLIVEVDGATHAQSGQGARDGRRDAAHEERGLRTLRIPAGEVLANAADVADRIARTATSSPLRPFGAPPLAGEDPGLVSAREPHP